MGHGVLPACYQLLHRAGRRLDELAAPGGLSRSATRPADEGWKTLFRSVQAVGIGTTLWVGVA